jgi:hypothetical protein
VEVAAFMPRSREQVFALIEKLVTKSCPFANSPEKGAGHMNEEKMKEVRWVKPKVVVEIAFNNVTVRADFPAPLPPSRATRRSTVGKSVVNDLAPNIIGFVSS